MMRTVTLSLALLLVSGANAFVGPDISGRSSPPRRKSFARSKLLLCDATPSCLQSYASSNSRRSGSTSSTKNASGCYQAEYELRQEAAPALRRASNDDPSAAHTATTTTTSATSASTFMSLAKQALATVALAAVFTSVGFVGEGAFSPPTGSGAGAGAGVGSGAGFVAPAYAELEPLPLKSYSEEFSSGLAPVNTVRGLWRTRETRNDGSVLPQEPGRLGKKGICGGRLSFKGFVGAGKGTVEYKGCGDREGKGRWLTKPKNIVNGRITLSARWSIKFADGTSLLYRGDVVQDAEAKGTALSVDTSGAAAMGGPAFERPDAHIRGEVLRPVTSVQGTLTEKKIGEFEADLIELPSDDDKM